MFPSREIVLWGTLRGPIGALRRELLPAAPSYGAASLKLARPRRGHDIWPTVVHRSKLGSVLAREVLVLLLQAGGFNVPVALRRHFGGARPRAEATRAAIVADPSHRSIINHRLVIHVPDVNYVDVIHAPVVKEGPTSPISPGIPYACVSESVIDSTVKTDMRAPIPRVPDEDPADPTPVTWSPQESRRGRDHPGAWNPVVAVHGIIGPIARSPDVTWARADRLGVDRQGRRTDPNRNRKLCGGGRGGCHHNRCHKHY